MESAKIILGPDAAQKLHLQKLKGQALANTLYLYEVSPLIRREGGNSYEADARVIFVKVPETHVLTFKDGSEEVAVTWGEVEIVPTEAQGLIYEKFSIPSRPKIIAWTLIFIGLIVLGLLGRKGHRKYASKQIQKKRLAELKQELLNGKEYQDVVSIWMKREDFLKAFPHIESSFRELESVLFKYQFKPVQSDVEKNIVIEAYRSFLSQISGGFNGV